MSLLDDPPDRITLYPQTDSTDTYGNNIECPSTEGVDVRCHVSRPKHSINRDSTERSQTNTLLVIIRDAPAIGVWSRAKCIDEFYSMDSVEQFNSSEATKHIELIIRKEQ